MCGVMIDVGMFDERAWRIRLALDDIEPDTGEFARRETFEDGIVVDERSATDVDEDRALSHLADKAAVDHVVRRRVERRVQDDDVAIRDQLVETDHFRRSGIADAHHVVGKYRRAEPMQLACRCASDAAIADDADGQFVRPPQTLGGEQSEAPRPHLAVVFVDAAREREHECDRMVGDFLDAVIRDVRYEYATFGRCGNCDVVRPDADTCDVPQVSPIARSLGA